MFSNYHTNVYFESMRRDDGTMLDLRTRYTLALYLYNLKRLKSRFAEGTTLSLDVS